MKVKPTQQEKNLTPYQRELSSLQKILHNQATRIKGAYNFHQLKTLEDYFKHLGLSAQQILEKNLSTSELQTPLQFNELTYLLDDERISQTCQLWLKYNPPERDKDESKNVEVCLPLSNTNTTVSKEYAIKLDKETKDEEPDEDNDYGLPPRIGSKVFLFWFQKKSCAELLKKTTQDKRRAILLVSATGSGKTFIMGEMLRRLWDSGYCKQSYSPWPIVWITKASVVEQTERVLEQLFDFNVTRECIVINIDQLRSKFGTMYIEEKIKVVDGCEHYEYIWRPILHPFLLVLDECQTVKNEDSTQSKIIQALCDITAPIHMYWVSATPFTRVAEAKAWVINAQPIWCGRKINKLSWPDFSKFIAEPFAPIDHSPTSIDKLMDYMDDWVVRVKGIKWQFRAQNSTKLMEFDNKEDKKFYEAAWDRYLDEKNKAEKNADAGGVTVSRFMILAQFTKFRQASELCHSNHIVEAMVDSYLHHHQAPVAGLNFKHTVIRCVKLLIEKHKVKREEISIIWGGGITISKKARQQAALTKDPIIQAGLKAAGVTMEDLGLGEDDVAEVDKLLKDEHIPPAYKLGTQNKKQRQEEIDRFQSGRSKYCFFTFKSGGVGLSLHHCDEQTIQKVRRKKNGYAYTEDISKIPTRPRICFLTPTYSAMELVQGLGRCPRLTSLSNTPQIILFFRNTIEERVAAIVSIKLKCLTKVTRAKDDWNDVILDAHSSEDAEARAIRKLQDAEQDVRQLPFKTATTEDNDEEELMDYSEDNDE